MAKDEVTRRQFIRRAGGAAGIAAVGLQAEAAESQAHIASAAARPVAAPAPKSTSAQTMLPPPAVIGYLSSCHDFRFSTASPPPTSKRLWDNFIKGMAEQGATLGSDYAVIEKFAMWDLPTLSSMASDLANGTISPAVPPVDVILAVDSIAVKAAWDAVQASTSNTHVIMAISGAPKDEMLVDDEIQPSKKVSGMTNHAKAVLKHRLKKLIQAMGTNPLLGAIYHTKDLSTGWQLQELDTAAAANGLTSPVLRLPVTLPTPVVSVTNEQTKLLNDLNGAWTGFGSTKPQALFILSDPWVSRHREIVVRWANSLKTGPIITAASLPLPPLLTSPDPSDVFPASYPHRDFVAKWGGYMSYGPDRYELMRLAAWHVYRAAIKTKTTSSTGATIHTRDHPVQGPVNFALVMYNPALPESLALTGEQDAEIIVELEGDEVLMD